jgi:hypothetical protein
MVTLPSLFTRRSDMKYKVELKDGSHNVIGLKADYGEYEDSLLVYHYPGGDVDTKMKDAGMMFGALYDLFQVSDVLADGDVFETEFGEYVCEGVHVVSLFALPHDTQHDFVDSSIETFTQDE